MASFLNKQQYRGFANFLSRIASGVSRTAGATETTSTSAATIATAAVGGARSDTFTVTGNGATFDRTSAPCSRFALQVTGTLTQVGTTTWTVILEGSLDGTTFTTILTHAYPATGDGITVYQAAGVLNPSRYFRARCDALTLGTATNVIAQVLGMP